MSPKEQGMTDFTSVDPKEEDFPLEVHLSGNALAVIAPTWQINPHKTWKDYYPTFKNDYATAARDYGARPKVGFRAYFADEAIVDRCVSPKLQHPLTPDGKFYDWFIPKPCPYFMGIDASNLASDDAGFCLCHFDGAYIIADLLHYWPGGMGEKFVFAEMERFVRTIKGRGFPLTQISFDSWQSYAIKENLSFISEAIVESTDTSTKMPDTVSGYMIQDKVRVYDHPLWRRQAKRLILINGRVDHRRKEKKDVWDAFVHAAYRLIDSGRVNFNAKFFVGRIE